jgi:3-phenylpropionate/trans-cinnamate dioxygenase ferredoxin component
VGDGLRREDVPPGRTRGCTVDGHDVLVCNVDGEFYAIADVCTHDRGPLGEGRLRGAVIECPRHGARFDVRDGSVKAPPAVRPIETYPVEVRDDMIEVSPR